MKFLFVIVVLLFSLSAFAQSKVDSLMNLCKNGDEKLKSNWYLELSSFLKNDTLTSNFYIRKAYQLAVKNHNIPEQAKAFFYLGENSYNSKDYHGAIDLYNYALTLYKSLNDSINISAGYKSVGLCHYYLYQGDKAIAQYIEGLKFCENDKANTAVLIFNIAKAHIRMGNINAAIYNYRKAISINKSIQNYSGIAANYNGLGEVQKNINHLDSALYFYSRANAIYRKIRRADNMAITLSNIAGVYLNFPDSVRKAIEYYNDSWEIFHELGWNQYEVEIRQGIGYAYYQYGNYNKAIENYKLSIALNDKYKRGIQLKTTNYELLARAYEKLYDYKTALKFTKLYHELSDSLSQKDKYEKIINLQKNYEVQKKENEILKLQANQELTDVKLHNSQLIKQLGFVTIVLLLIIVFFVSKKYTDKLKSNKLLEEKNQIIIKSEHELQLLNNAKNKFFSIIAHDLKNPFHTVMGYSWLLSKDYDRFSEVERKKFAFDIHHSSNNIFRLLQNLLEWSKSQTGRLSYTPRNVDFEKVLENSMSVLRLLAEQKHICVKTDIEPNLKIFVDPLMIETVLRNLINNAIKYTGENGRVEIHARNLDGKVSISVHDTGIGISDDEIRHLFQIDSKVKRKGTQGEDGSGLGLILCKEFVEINNGNIWALSTIGKGSTFIFTVPMENDLTKSEQSNSEFQELENSDRIMPNKQITSDIIS